MPEHHRARALWSAAARAAAVFTVAVLIGVGGAGSGAAATARSALAAPGPQLCARLTPIIVADAGRGEAAENVAVTRTGDVYTTLLSAGIVRERRADGAVVDHPVPVGTGGSVTGLAVDSADRVHVGVASPAADTAGVWRLDDGAPQRVVPLAADVAPNGIAVDSSGTFYIADSQRGHILRAPPGQPAEVWSQDPAIAPEPRTVTLPDGSTRPLSAGANGVHLVGRHLYVSVSGQATVVRYTVPDQGPPGAPEVVVRELFVDDFLVDADGAITAAASPDTVNATLVISVAPDGRRTTLARAADGLSTPSAIARLPGGDLVVSELGLFSATPRPGVVRVVQEPCTR